MDLEKITDVEQLRTILADEQMATTKHQALIEVLQEIDPHEKFNWSKERCEQFTNATMAHDEAAVANFFADNPSLKLLGLNGDHHKISQPFAIDEQQQIRQQCLADVRERCQPVIRRMKEIRDEMPAKYNVMNVEQIRQEIVQLHKQNGRAETAMFEVNQEHLQILRKAANLRGLPTDRNQAELLLLKAKQIEIRIGMIKDKFLAENCSIENGSMVAIKEASGFLDDILKGDS